MSQLAPFPFMRPTWLWLGAAAASELVGGILILLGLLTRVGAFLITCVMLTAIIGMHWPAFFMPAGIEFAVACLRGGVWLFVSRGAPAPVAPGICRTPVILLISPFSVLLAH